jgi:hypothetical protein
MASVVLTGDTSGTLTVSAPAVAGSNTQTLAAVTGTLAPIVSGTSVTASGTAIDFTSIPSWVKRVTVMFNGISSNGSSVVQIQIGSGSITSTGYSSVAVYAGATNSAGGTAGTTGFTTQIGNAASVATGHFLITNISGTTWICSYVLGNNVGGTIYSMTGGGSVTLGGALDRVRLTTVNGTDTFDAGSINILYE